MSDDDVLPQASYTAHGKERIRLWRSDMTELAKDAGAHQLLSVCTTTYVLVCMHQRARLSWCYCKYLQEQCFIVAGFLEAHSAALVQLMLHTLPFYQDLDSQRAVIATVKQAVVNGTFLKTLAGALVKLDAAAVSRQVKLIVLTL